jgi:hypothetical protein
MMTTLRFGRIDQDSHDAVPRRPATGPTFATPETFPDCTPVPHRSLAEIAAAAHIYEDDEHDLEATRPVSRMDVEEIEIGTRTIMGVTPREVRATSAEEIEIGTRTIMGVTPRAVRATATSGWVDAADFPVVRPMSSRVLQIEVQAPEVRPLSSEAKRSERAIGSIPAPEAIAIAPVPQAESHWADWDELVPAKAPRRAGRVLSRSYRVLGFGLLGAVVLVLAGYIATTAFYFFSTSWVAPVVVSSSDERVVAIKAELATQQAHRARLAAELAEADRPITGTKLELDAAAAARKTAELALARQDEIVRGIQQSALLRAASEKSSVAMVPYENLKGVKAGTKVYGCAFQMMWCRQVGSVLEVLPGEITFKHPRRDATMRGQMIQLQLMVPEAADKAMLFLDGAPLLL